MTESLTDCVMWHLSHVVWFKLNSVVQVGVLFWSEATTSCISQVDLTPPFPLTQSLWPRISPVVEFKQEVHSEPNRK